MALMTARQSSKKWVRRRDDLLRRNIILAGGNRTEEYQAPAYLSINNAASMLVARPPAPCRASSQCLTYLLIYVVTTIGSFLVVLQLRDTEGNFDRKNWLRVFRAPPKACWQMVKSQRIRW